MARLTLNHTSERRLGQVRGGDEMGGFGGKVRGLRRKKKSDGCSS